MTTSRNEGMKPAYCAWCDSKDCIHAERDNMTVELAFLRKERGEMGKALRKYGDHYPECALIQEAGKAVKPPCNCGFDAALSAAGELK